MKSTRAASRYAKALLDLAIERKELEKINEDVVVVYNAITGTRDLQLFLSSPVVKPKVKQAVLKEIFANSVSELTMHFILLIVQHGREVALKAILGSFIDQYRAYNNIAEATITTSTTVSKQTMESIQKKLADALGKKVELVEKVDENLIGGFIIETNNYRMDASLSGSMRKLKRELTK